MPDKDTWNRNMKTTGEPSANIVLISEIFFSLQGEGPWAGLPAVFVRLGGCVEPLCPWCDTAYAWSGGERTGTARILETVRSHSCRRVVITGGEPFLQWDSGLKGLHRALASQEYEIQYETSGKVIIPSMPDALVVCSPKHIGGAWCFKEDNLGVVDVFKFVAGGIDWFERIDEFIARYGIGPEKVCIMPLGATRNEQIRNTEPVFTYCRQRGYRMSPRLQILAFDAGRGI
jgi:7-carboxy-7-deazaguanine synthase